MEKRVNKGNLVKFMNEEQEGRERTQKQVISCHDSEGYIMKFNKRGGLQIN